MSLSDYLLPMGKKSEKCFNLKKKFFSFFFEKSPKFKIFKIRRRSDREAYKEHSYQIPKESMKSNLSYHVNHLKKSIFEKCL